MGSLGGPFPSRGLGVSLVLAARLEAAILIMPTVGEGDKVIISCRFFTLRVCVQTISNSHAGPPGESEFSAQETRF